jgi:hypothetical protein
MVDDLLTSPMQSSTLSPDAVDISTAQLNISAIVQYVLLKQQAIFNI